MTLLKKREINGGEQRVFRYKNGYGASVVRGPYTYGGDEGKFELAVLLFADEDSDTYELDYSTPITDDVIGYLDEDEVQEYLKQIEAL